MICLPERNPLYPSLAPSDSVPFLPLPQFGTFTFFLTETKVSFPKASCCLFVLLIYNCWQQSGTNPINCFSIRQICQIPPNPNKFSTTRISRFCNNQRKPPKSLYINNLGRLSTFKILLFHTNIQSSRKIQSTLGFSHKRKSWKIFAKWSGFTMRCWFWLSG